MKQLVMISAVVIAALISACGRVANDTPDPGAPAATGTYTLVFSGANPAGTHILRFVNLAFTIDRSQPVREFFAPEFNETRLPGLIKSNDLSDCTTTSPGALESGVQNLPRGELAAVESIDLEAVVVRPETPQPPWKAGACFGYRAAGGSWTWNLQATPFTYDSATDRWRAHLAGAQGLTDAIKIAFVLDGPGLLLTRVTYNSHTPAGNP